MRKSSLFALLFTLFNDGLGWGIVVTIFAPLLFDHANPILPADTSDAVRSTLVGVLIGSYACTQFFFMPIIGALSDHFGRKRILLGTIFMAAMSSVVAAIAIAYSSLFWLLAARLFAGIFSGNAGAAQASIADMSSENTKGKNLALTGAAVSAAWIIGPPLGGIISTPHLVSWFNFSVPFWLVSFFFFINLIWIAVSFSETYVKKAKHDWKQEIKDLLKLSKIPHMKGSLGVSGLFYLGYYFFLFFYSTFLVKTFGYDQEQIGYLSAYWAFFWFIGSLILNRWLGDKISAPMFLLWSLPVLAICIIANAKFESIVGWYGTFVLMGLAGTASWTASLSLCSNRAGSANQGKVFGVIQSLQSMMLFIGPISAGFIAAYGIRIPFYTSAAIILGSAALMGWLHLRKKII